MSQSSTTPISARAFLSSRTLVFEMFLMRSTLPSGILRIAATLIIPFLLRAFTISTLRPGINWSFLIPGLLPDTEVTTTPGFGFFGTFTKSCWLSRWKTLIISSDLSPAKISKLWTFLFDFKYPCSRRSVSMFRANLLEPISFPTFAMMCISWCCWLFLLSLCKMLLWGFVPHFALYALYHSICFCT